MKQPDMAMRERVRHVCVTAAVAALLTAASARAQTGGACPEPSDAAGVVASIAPGLEPVLTDGRRLSIAGVEPPPGAQGETARKALGDWLTGREVRLHILAAAPDRWGRIPVHLHAQDLTGRLTLAAHALVDAGLARVRVHAEAGGCLAELLRAEQVARAAREGIWVLEAYRVRNANRPDDLGSGWILAEGRVSSVNETRNRTYINFGPARNVDLAVTIPRQTLRSFTAAGLEVKQLRGKVIRVRGLVERRPGPQIEAVLPQTIEVLGAKAGPATP